MQTTSVDRIKALELAVITHESKLKNLIIFSEKVMKSLEHHSKVAAEQSKAFERLQARVAKLEKK